MTNNRRILLFLLFFAAVIQLRFVHMPARNKLRALDKLLEDKKIELSQLQEMCTEYRQYESMQKANNGKTVQADFSLFSFTGNLLSKHKLEKNVAGIQPLPLSEKQGFLTERLRLGMKDIRLKQLYDFLNEIENSSNAILIPEFRMRRNKENPYFLNVEIELAAVKALNPQETANQTPLPENIKK